MGDEITWEKCVRRIRTPAERRIARFIEIESAARALVDAINADGDVDITPQANALAEALESKP